MRLLFSLVLVLVPPSVASAQGPATHVLRARHEEVSHLAEQEAGPARDAAVSRVLTELVDYDAFAARALGTHWTSASEAQRSAYVDALRHWLLRRYGPRVSSVREYRVEFRREEPGIEPVVHVTARSIAAPRAEPLEIACRVHRVGSDWRVIDIVTDEVSLAAWLGRRADRALREGGAGWDALVASLER